LARVYLIQRETISAGHFDVYAVSGAGFADAGDTTGTEDDWRSSTALVMVMWMVPVALLAAKASQRCSNAVNEFPCWCVFGAIK
jgi:hypothetical protein